MSTIPQKRPIGALQSPMTITWATVITLLRPVLLAVAILCGFIGWRSEARWVELGFAFGFIAALTDFLDGKISQWLNCKSDLGAALDTFMDKAFHFTLIMACAITIAKDNMLHAQILVFYIIISMARDMYVASLKHVATRHEVSIEPTWFGKARVVAYMLLGAYLYLYAFESKLLGEPTWLAQEKLMACYILEAIVTAITALTWIGYHRHYRRAFEQAPSGS
jgi:phosphatidylglycerophosphate synthase